MKTNKNPQTESNNHKWHSAFAIDASTEPLGFSLTLLIIALLIVVAGITYKLAISSVSFVAAVTLSWLVALILSIGIYGLVRVFR